MNKLYLVLFLFYPFLINAQDILWEKSYGGKHADYLFDAQPTADYGFILAGSSLSNKTGNKTEDNHGDLDYWVWKMNEKGDLDWQKSLGGSGFDLLQSIKNTKDGGFILAGTSNSGNDFQKKDTCKGVTDFWIVKLDAKGGEQWQKTIGGSGQDELITAFQTRDGGYILGGSSSSNPSIKKKNPNEKSSLDVKPDLYGKSEKSRGNMDYWIVKLDKEGVVQWQKTYGGEYTDLLRSMGQTKEGGYVLGGYSNSPQSGDKTDGNIGIGDYWIVKIDDKGTIEWQKTYGGNGDNQLYVIHQTDDGGYIAGGNSNSTSPLTPMGGMVNNGTDYWILKMDDKGTIVWSQTYDFGKVDILTSLVENKDHTFLIGGYAQSENTNSAVKIVKRDKEGINDYIALKINEQGEILWNKTVGSSGEDILRKLIETRDGGYLLTGTSNAKSSRDKNSAIGSNDFWVVKIKDKKKPIEKKATIEAIPNPAVTFTNIIIGYEFETGTATLVDMAGRILQQFSITSRTVPVDLSRYPDGVYVVNIKTNVQSDGVKVIKGGKN
ncbi:T9SS type A sorting domain-containing protein [Flavobacterium sp. ZS1P14]|uniref:T9SS type A sorting domain-containing protein n=1 Tax=Flavobacterium sp. ZS1P14 TaxID=3401729 RepID=UPI003AAA405E